MSTGDTYKMLSIPSWLDEYFFRIVHLLRCWWAPEGSCIYYTTFLVLPPPCGVYSTVTWRLYLLLVTPRTKQFVIVWFEKPRRILLRPTYLWIRWMYGRKSWATRGVSGRGHNEDFVDPRGGGTHPHCFTQKDLQNPTKIRGKKVGWGSKMGVKKMYFLYMIIRLFVCMKIDK